MNRARFIFSQLPFFAHLCSIYACRTIPAERVAEIQGALRDGKLEAGCSTISGQRSLAYRIWKLDEKMLALHAAGLLHPRLG